MKRLMTKKLTFVVLMLAIIAASAYASPEYRKLTILHTNDTHGHLLPFIYPFPDANGKNQWISVGGITRRAYLAKKIAAEEKNPTILVDAGDALDGTPFSVEYMGEADFAAMNAAGYALKTFGNHEFSASLKEFERNLKICTFPTISANLKYRSSALSFEPGYKIMDFDGVKVAFIGLTRMSPEYKAAKEGFDFEDPIATAKVLVPELKKLADIIIAITHIGYSEDKRLASEVPGINVIVGAHSHTLLTKPTFVGSANRIDPFSVNGTVIVQDGEWGVNLGKLELFFRRDNSPFTLMSYKGELIPVTAQLAEDARTKSVLDKYYKPISKYYDEVIGTATADFVTSEALLNLVCEGMRFASKSDIAIYNTGGIRSVFAAGKIKMWNIADVMPFQNNVVVLNITGARLKQALSELKPGVSGLRYKIDTDDKLVEASISGQPIEDTKSYSVSTNSFVADNGFKDITDIRDTKMNVREAVKQFIISQKEITPVEDGRRIMLGTSAPM